MYSYICSELEVKAMIIKSFVTFSFFILLSVINVSAQDPLFSNYDQNLSYSNPAFTGSGENFRVGSLYRNQWPSTSANYQTSSTFADIFLNKMGIGLNYILDSAGRGTLKSQNADLSVAYSLPIGLNSHLRFGAELGLLAKRLDWSRITFNDMIDPRSGFIYTTQEIPRGGQVNKFDIDLGALFHHERFYLGYSVNHLNSPNVSLIGGESPLIPRHDFQFGLNFPLKKGVITLTNNTVYQHESSISRFRAQLIYSKVLFALGSRTDAWSLIPISLGLDFENFRVLYSHERNFKKEADVLNLTSHEIGFQLLLNVTKSKNTNPILY